MIRGRVFDTANGTPMRKAVVTIFGAEIRESRSAATDPEGRYEFTDLPAGQYTIIGWHERVGERSASVRVDAGRAATVDLTVPVEDVP